MALAMAGAGRNAFGHSGKSAVPSNNQLNTKIMGSIKEYIDIGRKMAEWQK